MNRALREYISDQKRETLESVMSLLKMKMDFDATAIDHLHLALLSFKVWHHCKNGVHSNSIDRSIFDILFMFVLHFHI